MNSIKEQLTESYTRVDDFFKGHPKFQRQRRSPNDHPKITDVEVISIALMQGYFHNEELKAVYLLVRANDPQAVKYWCSYQQWLARLHALTAQLQIILGATCALDEWAQCLYLIDSKPIPVCLPIRHGRVRLLREDGAHFGKSSKGWFFGFKLHLLRHIDGRILNLILTPVTGTTVKSPWRSDSMSMMASSWPTSAIAETPSKTCSWRKPTCFC